MTQAQPHTIAAGRYLLVQPIGEGGMAVVYRGFDQRLKVWRAIKVLNKEFSKSRKIRARFDTEAQTMALLEHPNIVRVYDVGSVGDVSYIVMELVEGGTPVDWLERYGAMPLRMALDVTDQLCRGIQFAHDQGVIHRDIKPHNVLVTTNEVVRVTDFGIARVDTSKSLTKTGAVMGTWGFMAPEQRSDAKNVDERADVYACAATLYTLVSNRIPMDLFAADRDKSMMAGVPDELLEVMLKATNYHRDERHATVEEFRQALIKIREVSPALPRGCPALALSAGERRPPPTPEFVATATPLEVSDVSLVGSNPTLHPGTAAGATPISPPRMNSTLDVTHDVSPVERRKRGAGAWLVALVPGVIGVLLMAVAGVIALPVLAGMGQADDTGQPIDDGLVDVDSSALPDTDVETETETETETEAVKTPIRHTVKRQVDPLQSGAADLGTETAAQVQVQAETDTAQGTPDDDTETEVASPVRIEPVAVAQCVNAMEPSSVRVGAKAVFQATLCDEDKTSDVILWYRPAGTDAWQSVKMPFVLAKRRAVVTVDERFASGLEYYVQASGASKGSRAAPLRVGIN